MKRQGDRRMVPIIRTGEMGADRELGGKAAALAALHQTNVPVPPWFVVVPAAFTASISDAQRVAFEAACAGSELAAIETLFATIQPGEDVRQEIEQAVAALCPRGERVAVRSSALDEDGAHYSFAGQLETFLFVPREQVVEKIIAVWRSGFSARALAYRHEHHLRIPPEPPAVLVQRMVEAEVAGVAFSAHPITGQRGIAMVSALYGLGTALVSGECDADTYTIDRQGAILSRSLAEKKIAHRPLANENGEAVEGIEAASVSPELANKPALDDASIQAIAALARRCEQHFGCPQDIEWAIADNKLFLLQTRPVTSLAQMPDPDGQYALWDNSNIAESYNGVTTPLTFSFARFAYEQVYRQMCRVLGVPEAVIQLHDDTFRHMIGLIQGRVYYNLLNWYRLLSLMPGFTSNPKFMEQMMGVKEGLPEGLVAGSGQSTWDERLKDRLRLLTTLGALLTSYRRLPRDIQRFFQRVDQALGTTKIELEQMRADELVDTYRSLARQLITHWDAPLVNDLYAMFFYGLLRVFVAKWCGAEGASLQNDLLTGEGGIISAEPAARVRKMAELASSHPMLVESLCSGSWGEIQRAMIAVPAFSGEYQAYLDKFADRCLEELKLESATLRDNPLPLLRSIGHLARRLQTNSVEPSIDEGAPRRQAEQRVALALRGHPLRRLFFGWVLKQARARVRDRENLRFERTRVFGRVRRLFTELGLRFSALNLLEEPRDIFYLEVEEALGFVTGSVTTTNLKGLVSVRKTEYAHFETLAVPSDRFETRGIVNHGHTFVGTTRPASSGSEAHKGSGCCPGVVRGPVRVITDPQNAKIREGEILVAQRTDPGWIMLFPAAAGVLVEHGSLLSHSAIVAREMGIPTIVALSDATSWLQDGDWVEMDGSSGLVRKIDPPITARSLSVEPPFVRASDPKELAYG
jgi:phosphohistidine swiveling domain-containing protein